MPEILETFRNRCNLVWSFPCTEDDFWEALSYCSVVVDAGNANIGKRQSLETPHRIVGLHLA